jgi:DNA invertase Pin-like site-specific DNA recombinase
MRIGYARVSTDDQSLDLQRDQLKRARAESIYEEYASGKNTEPPNSRPVLRPCAKATRSLSGASIVSGEA